MSHAKQEKNTASWGTRGSNMDGPGARHREGTHPPPVEWPTSKLCSIENRNDRTVEEVSLESHVHSPGNASAGCGVARETRYLIILSVGSPGEPCYDARATASKPANFTTGGRGFGRIFYSPNHVPAFRSRPHSSRAKPPKSISQSASAFVPVASSYKKATPSPTSTLFLHPPPLFHKRPNARLTSPIHDFCQLSNHTHNPTQNPVKMPPKSADKKPASKAPVASKAPEKKDAAGKKTAATGEKKKRTKARKETYSSYIYKGEFLFPAPPGRAFHRVIPPSSADPFCSPEAGPPRHWYLQPRHVHPQLLRQR